MQFQLHQDDAHIAKAAEICGQGHFPFSLHFLAGFTDDESKEVCRARICWEAIGFRNFFIKGGFQVSSNIVSLHLLQVILLQNTGNMAVEIDFGLPGNSDSVKLGDEPVGDQGHSCYLRRGALIGLFWYKQGQSPRTLSPEQITALMMVSNALGEESKRLHAKILDN